jgi:HNH endonuclease
VVKKTYSEQYRSPKWQKKRLEVLSAADFQCQDCGSKENTLNVHHVIYHKGREVWNYTNDELMVLCEKCHETRHRMQSIMLMNMRNLTPADVLQVVGYIHGMIFDSWMRQNSDHQDIEIWDDEFYCQGIIDAWWGWNGSNDKPTGEELRVGGVLTSLMHDCYGLCETPSQFMIDHENKKKKSKDAT